MTDGSEAIAKIRKEVDEHQSSVILSNSCLKSQRSLLKKLKQQSERQKVECRFISSSNFRLEIEIKLEELKLKSLNTALDTIQSANIEAKKDLLLTKERRCEIEERVRNGSKKYEDTWTVAKGRYENISFVKNYLEFKNKIDTVQKNLKLLINDSDELSTQVNKKRCEVAFLEKQRILQLAEFLVIERPKILKNISENESIKNKINDDIQKILQENKIDVSLRTLPQHIELTDTKRVSEITENNRPDLKNSAADLVLPSIQLQSMDLDVMSVRLDQIKKVESSKNLKRQSLTIFKEPVKNVTAREFIKDDSISSYFNVCRITNVEDEPKKDFSNKKFIHILEDIKIDKNEAHGIVAKINPSDLKDVAVISAEVANSKVIKDTDKHSQKQPIETDEIEEIDLTATNSQINVLPPTQFMDLTQDTNLEISKHGSIFTEEISKKQSQEKTVSVDIKESIQDEMETDNGAGNTSIVSNESYTQVKEMMLKKYNLDLSPQFNYSKNPLQAKPKENTVTSKFFEAKEHTQNIGDSLSTQIKDNEYKHMENNVIVNNQKDDKQQKDSCSKDGQSNTVAGLLFTHGQQGILDSLELSVSTAEYEGDSDYPHGIDSSLLLSPKADDMPMSNAGNNNPISQEVPNFFTGLRKTGFSFFGGLSSSGDNQEKSSGSQENNNFTFSFGGEQKKNKGGLFNMFR